MKEIITGVIKSFNKERRGGFISVQERDDYFFLLSDITNKANPVKGERVIFKAGIGDNGCLQAFEVDILDIVKCSRCCDIFGSQTKKAEMFAGVAELKKCLAPYGKFSKHLVALCPDCYELCKKDCLEVEDKINRWVDGVRADHIHGFKTVKKLERVEYKGSLCSDPAELEEYLQRYCAQLGGNGFIKYYYKENVEREPKEVLVRYSENGNPYYRTEYSIKRWFTGFATAVYVEPLMPESLARSTCIPYKKRDVRLAVLDGLNICYWSSLDSFSPDLSILISLCIGLAEDGLPFFCFFDANTPYVLREQVGEETEKIYKELVFGDLSKCFVEVPGRKQADEFILQKANCDGGHVISNDQFRDFDDLYAWLRSEDRLLKGAVVDNHLLIPDLQFDCRIRKDLTRALTTLRKTLKV